MEIFKEFNFDETLFRVGNRGTIYRNGIPARIVETPDGYYQVSCKHRSIGVHRFVAMCFVPGRTAERNEVNHKDFDRKNNCCENLEWVSHADNIAYSARSGHRPDFSGTNNPNYGNRKLSIYYAENPQAAAQKQSRPGAQNGRAQPIEVYKDGSLIGRFEYLGACHSYMRSHFTGIPDDTEAFRCGIRRSNKLCRPYKGFIFKKF